MSLRNWRLVKRVPTVGMTSPMMFPGKEEWSRLKPVG